MNNLTSDTLTYIEDNFYFVSVSKHSTVNIYYYINMYGIGIFDNYYKYMYKSIFTKCASIRISPLLSLPVCVLLRILYIGNVPYNDIYVLHPYLRTIYLY